MIILVLNEDDEIERINKKKMEELIARKKAQLSHPAQDSSGRPIVLSDASFYSEISKHHLILVDFWAAWCGPCRMIAPIIEQLASEYSGKVAFGKLNVDENPMISSTFGVQSIPTMILFSNGNQVDRIVGVVPKAHIESRFKPFLGSGSVYG